MRANLVEVEGVGPDPTEAVDRVEPDKADQADNHNHLPSPCYSNSVEF